MFDLVVGMSIDSLCFILQEELKQRFQAEAQSAQDKSKEQQLIFDLQTKLERATASNESMRMRFDALQAESAENGTEVKRLVGLQDETVSVVVCAHNLSTWAADVPRPSLLHPGHYGIPLRSYTCVWFYCS